MPMLVGTKETFRVEGARTPLFGEPEPTPVRLARRRCAGADGTRDRPSAGHGRAGHARVGNLPTPASTPPPPTAVPTPIPIPTPEPQPTPVAPPPVAPPPGR